MGQHLVRVTQPGWSCCAWCGGVSTHFVRRVGQLAVCGGQVPALPPRAIPPCPLGNLCLPLRGSPAGLGRTLSPQMHPAPSVRSMRLQPGNPADPSQPQAPTGAQPAESSPGAAPFLSHCLGPVCRPRAPLGGTERHPLCQLDACITAVCEATLMLAFSLGLCVSACPSVFRVPVTPALRGHHC